MPSIIIGSPRWNATGLTITAQSAQEQINGLLNVQVTYVAPATKQTQASAKFYLDAAPPIWPSVVERSELVTNNLYMVDRTIERANGMVTVQANYVGGLQRAGFRGYYLREQVEYGKLGQAYNYGKSTLGTFFVYTPTGSLANVGYNTAFTYDERIKLVEFVRIGRLQAVTLPTFYRSDLASILKQSRSGRSSYSNAVVDGTPVFSPSGGIGTWRFSSDSPEAAESADLWVAAGPADALRAGLLSFEKTSPVPSTESAEFITPTVQVVSRIYRLSRQ